MTPDEYRSRNGSQDLLVLDNGEPVAININQGIIRIGCVSVTVAAYNRIRDRVNLLLSALG